MSTEEEFVRKALDVFRDDYVMRRHLEADDLLSNADFVKEFARRRMEAEERLKKLNQLSEEYMWLVQHRNPLSHVGEEHNTATTGERVMPDENNTGSPPQPSQGGSKDGDGAGDHDEPYRMGRPRATAKSPEPFTPRQYAKLLITRGRFQDGLTGADDRAADSSESQVQEQGRLDNRGVTETPSNEPNKNKGAQWQRGGPAK